MVTRRTVLSFFVLSTVGLVFWLAGCSEAPDPWAGKPAPRILVSIPPLYSFAKNVAGEHGEVKSLCKETGPHHYDHSTTDLRLLNGSTRFFTIGLKLDDKFSDAMVTTTGKGDLRVALGNKLPDDLKCEGECHHEPGDNKPHVHETDPHVWLGNAQAIAMVEMIRDELKKVDETNKAKYDQNAAAYINELKRLKEDGLAMLKPKKGKRIISFHDSLQYFTLDFDIVIVAVIEEVPGDEPGAKKLIDLVKKCIDEDVRVIAVEPQYPKTTAASVLLRELEAKGKKDVVLVEIDPLETATEKELTADLYIKTMRKNLDNLAKALP